MDTIYTLRHKCERIKCAIALLVDSKIKKHENILDGFDLLAEFDIYPKLEIVWYCKETMPKIYEARDDLHKNLDELDKCNFLQVLIKHLETTTIKLENIKANN